MLTPHSASEKYVLYGAFAFFFEKTFCPHYKDVTIQTMVAEEKISENLPTMLVSMERGDKGQFYASSLTNDEVDTYILPSKIWQKKVLDLP